MSDTKIDNCYQTSPRVWPALFDRAGGNAAPPEVQGENKRVYEAFECEDHFVAIEQVGDQYYYFYGSKDNVTKEELKDNVPVFPGTRLVRFDPKHPAIWRDNFVLLHDPQNQFTYTKNYFVIPIKPYGYFNAPGQLEEFYLKPHFFELAGAQLVKDSYVESLDQNNSHFRLELTLANEEYLPFEFPFTPRPFVPVKEPVAPTPTAAEEPSTPFVWPWDQVYARGDGGSHIYFTPPKKDKRDPTGSGEVGVSFFKPTSAVDIGLKAIFGPEHNGAGGISAGVRYPDRPLLRSSVTLQMDLDFQPDLQLRHTALFPPLILGNGNNGAFFQPFASFEHWIDENDLRFVAGIQVGGFGTGMLDPQSDEWDEERVAALLADQVLLGATTGLLASNISDLHPLLFFEKDVQEIDAQLISRTNKQTLNMEALAAGIGFASGQMAFLDSMLLEAFSGGKVSKWEPTISIISKGILGWGTLAMGSNNPPEESSTVGLGYFGHGMLLQTLVGSLQPLLEIDPADSRWILANATAGAALLVAYARKSKESDWTHSQIKNRFHMDAFSDSGGNAHLSLAGTFFSSYALNLWLHANGWDRF